MNRREVVGLTATGAPAAALAEALVSAQQARSPATSGKVAPTTSPSAKMKVGTQHGHTEDILRACAAIGVHNICSELPSRGLDEAWSVESLTRLRDRVAWHHARHGADPDELVGDLPGRDAGDLSRPESGARS